MLVWALMLSSALAATSHPNLSSTQKHELKHLFATPYVPNYRSFQLY
jgi:hypothetical protein